MKTVIDEDNLDQVLNQEDVRNYINQIISAMSKDDREEFVKLVTVGSYEIHPPLLLRWTIYHRALQCTESIFSSDTGPILKKIWFEYYDMSPVHEAVTNFLPEFVQLFIKHDASVDTISLEPGSDYYHMMPVEAALEKLCQIILWTPAQSIYRLIFGICNSTTELEQAMCAISHVMRASLVRENRRIIRNYASDGLIIELAIFLYIDAIFELGIFKGFSEAEFLDLYQLVETSSPLPEKNCNYYVVDVNEVIKPIGWKELSEDILKLLNIFHQTDFSQLKLSTASPEILAERIVDAGFHCSDGDLQSYIFDNVIAAKVLKHHKAMDVLPSGAPFHLRQLKLGTASLEIQAKRIAEAGFHSSDGDLQNPSYIYADNVAAAKAVKHHKALDALPSGAPLRFRSMGMLDNHEKQGTLSAGSRFKSNLSGPIDDLPEAVKETISRRSIRLRTSFLYALHVFGRKVVYA